MIHRNTPNIDPSLVLLVDIHWFSSLPWLWFYVLQGDKQGMGWFSKTPLHPLHLPLYMLQ
jgi:hypothetical protein